MTKLVKQIINVFNFGKNIFYVQSNNNDDRDSDCDSDSDESSKDDDDSDDDEEDDDVERFKSIDGYDNYSVSTFGRIRNDTTNKILRPGKTKTLYRQVSLYKNGKVKKCYIHKLVGLAFYTESR